jgi:serine/threonine-protein kinase RsbW
MTNYWRFPSTPGCISELEQLVDHLASKYHISQDKYPNILISLTEAVNNAIIHGNHCDECKCVHVQIEEQLHGLPSPSETKAGFDPNDGCHSLKYRQTGGRGIFLIKQLCDGVRV